MNEYLAATLITMAIAAFAYKDGWRECMSWRRVDRMNLWELESEYRHQKEIIDRLDDENEMLRTALSRVRVQLRDRVRPKLP